MSVSGSAAVAVDADDGAAVGTADVGCPGSARSRPTCVRRSCDLPRVGRNNESRIPRSFRCPHRLQDYRSLLPADECDLNTLAYGYGWSCFRTSSFLASPDDLAYRVLAAAPAVAVVVAAVAALATRSERKLAESSDMQILLIILF